MDVVIRICAIVGALALAVAVFPNDRLREFRRGAFFTVLATAALGAALFLKQRALDSRDGMLFVPVIALLAAALALEWQVVTWFRRRRSALRRR